MSRYLSFSYLFNCLFVCLSISFCNLASGQVYKWVDENGKVHYSDKPIDDKAESVDIKADISTTRQQEARVQANKLIQSQRRQIANEQEEKRDAAVAERKQKQQARKLNNACRQARASLRALEYQAPVYHENNKGERTYLDDETRKKEATQTRANIKKHCDSQE